MNPLHLIDISWKLLFFISISSTILFLFNIASFSFLQRVSTQASMRSLKTMHAFLLSSFFGVGLYLAFTDQDIIADCFNQFASENGVFGFTRWIGITWLTVAVTLLTKDFTQYAVELRRLEMLSIESLNQPLIDKNNTLNSVAFHKIESGYDAVVAGLFRPHIYIPEDMCQDQQQLKYVLAHESIHYKNKDGFWNLLSALLVRLNWFNPLAYIAFKMNHHTLEMATDEQAITDYNLDIHDYAKHLVTWIAKQRMLSPLSVAASDEFKQIQSRLLHLRNMKTGLRKNRSFYAICLFMTSALGLTQAFASIHPPAPDTPIQMCFQVKHELIIENWVQPKESIVPNKCE